MQLVDNHNRPINYLRISVTDRCNLRCTYCMPERGMKFDSHSQLLSHEEMLRVIRIFSELGVNKIRFTGGEPFVREDLISLMKKTSDMESIHELSVTTNGTVLSEDIIKELEETKLKTINLSMDAMNADKFKEISRRDSFEKIFENIRLLLDSRFEIKINCVVMADKNVSEILPFIDFAKNHNVTVRFLEEMPFNGANRKFEGITWNHVRILDYITAAYPDATKLPVPPNSTSSIYQVPGHKGKFGIIPSYSRTFCGTCNRVRVSHAGEMRTCLYGNNVLNIRDLVRSGATDLEMKDQIIHVIQKRAKDGFEAQANRSIKESMTKIGG